jgi:ubiquinone/menaquinone biosynthesis C-methylase UbiE
MTADKQNTNEIIFGNVYNKYTSKNPIVRVMMKNFHRSVSSLLIPLKCKRVAEVGCGEGYLTNFIREIMPDAEIFAFDLTTSAAAIGVLDKSAHFHVASVYQMPYADKQFDLIIASELLEHLKDCDPALKEMKRVASEYCLFSVPREPYWRLLNMARLKYLKEFGNTPGHYNHWKKSDFIALIRKYFEIVAVMTPIPWTVVLAKTE